MIKQFVSIYPQIEVSKPRQYYVWYEEIDTKQQKFVKERLLLSTTNLTEAEECAKKSAKKNNISLCLWTDREQICVLSSENVI